MKKQTKYIDMYSNHDFEKVNPVTTDKGTDIYRCTLCGLQGTRVGLEGFIAVTKDIPCKGRKKPVVIKVKITHFTGGNYGLEDDSEHLTVPCPDPHKPQYENDVWVQSPITNAPVRLLPYEYKILEP